MKKIITIVCSLGLLLGLTGCNKQIIDLDYRYDYAIVERHDGEEKIEIKSWNDYENSDQIQITSTDGKVYLLHSSKVILVKE